MNSDTDTRAITFGRAIDLRPRPARRTVWFGAAWAALCGAVATGQLVLEAQSLLRLALALALADLLLGGLWSALRGATEPVVVDAPAESNSADARPSAPHLMPGWVARRVLGRFARWAVWARRAYWPTRGGAVTAGLVTAGLALTLGWTLGPTVAWLVAGGLLFVALLWMLLGTVPLRFRSVLALLEIGLGWHLGFAALGGLSALAGGREVATLTPLAVPVAAGGLYTLVYFGCLRLAVTNGLARLSHDQHRPQIRETVCQENGSARSGVWLINLGQLAVAVGLIALRQPVWGVAAGLALLAQLPFQPALACYPGVQLRDIDGRGYLQRTQWFLMAGMLSAGLGIARWLAEPVFG